MKERRWSNFIGSIVTYGVLKESVEDIKEEVRRFSSVKFVESNFNRLCFDGIPIMKISSEENISIEASFTGEEIKAVVWGCKVSKILGPDGYNFYFIRKCWSFMKEDFNRFFITYSFLTLVPKNNAPMGLGDYRLICLVGCL